MISPDAVRRPSHAMTLQDTASGVALWRQVADGIERGIADGSFAAGERLPAEMEIAQTHRVNPPPLPPALAARAERGPVPPPRRRRPHVGTPPTPHPPPSPPP